MLVFSSLSGLLVGYAACLSDRCRFENMTICEVRPPYVSHTKAHKIDVRRHYYQSEVKDRSYLGESQWLVIAVKIQSS